MLQDLSIDELRWLEASEILEFPASPSDTFTFNDRVVPRFSLQGRQWSDTARSRYHHHPPSQSISTSFHDSRPPSKASSAPCASSLPTPPATPTRAKRNSPQLKPQDSPQWLHRRPRTVTPRGSPGSSALSSSLSLHQLSSHKSLSRCPSSTSTTMKEDNDRKSTGSSKDPFWSAALRPRSRSLRSVPLLKTIPSQSEVALLPPPYVASDDSSSSVVAGIRAPSTSSTISSASSHSSSRPETPSDQYGPFLKSAQLQTKGFSHRRYPSNPTSSHPFRLAHPISASCPNKSILTRTSSISTKDSATLPNKSVKFVEVPTVHYANHNAGDVPTSNKRMEAENPEEDLSIPRVSRRGSRTGYRRDRAHPVYGTLTREDLEELGLTDLLTASEEAELPEDPSKEGLRRFVPFTRRPSASDSPRTPACPNTSSAPIPIPTSPNSGRPSISGPYPLGAFTPVSPSQSTTSLRSNMSKSSRKSNRLRKPPKAPRSFFSFSSASTTPTASISHLYGTGTSSMENYTRAGNPANRSERSLSSVKSGTSATTGLKSFLARFTR